MSVTRLNTSVSGTSQHQCQWHVSTPVLVARLHTSVSGTSQHQCQWRVSHQCQWYFSTPVSVTRLNTSVSGTSHTSVSGTSQHQCQWHVSTPVSVTRLNTTVIGTSQHQMTLPLQKKQECIACGTGARGTVFFSLIVPDISNISNSNDCLCISLSCPRPFT